MADSTLDLLKLSPPLNMPSSLDGRVLNVINGDLPNADTSYFYIPIGKAGFNIFALQFTITATTLTFEGTNDSPSVDDASAAWTDITNIVTIGSPGGPVTTITATGSMTVSFPLPWSRLRVKRVTTNATNALALYLTRGRLN